MAAKRLAAPLLAALVCSACGSVSRAASGTAAIDTAAFTFLAHGHVYGERRVWREPGGAWHYTYEGSGPFGEFPRTERLWLDDAGFPVRLTIEGQRNLHEGWEELFSADEDTVRWSAATVDSRESLGSRRFDSARVGREGVAAFYTALHPVHDLGVLARALLARPDSSASLLPAGTARLEPLERFLATAAGDSARVRLFALHGLGVRPRYVWLASDGETFADEHSVRSGWEVVFPELRERVDRALADHHAELARALVPPARRRPLVIHDARLFDALTGRSRPGSTVVVTGNRITAVGWDDSVSIPRGADSLDAMGRMLLPGLWDLHVHSGTIGASREMEMPLHLAAGITSVRDMGTDPEAIASLRERIDSGRALGPRVLPSGWIDGARPVAPLVRTAEEARAAVDRYAEQDFRYIKIWSHASRDVATATIERAWTRGLRVGGHVPEDMTAEAAVAAGYKEISHLAHLLDLVAADEWAVLDPGAPAVRELIDLFVTNHIALDPTLAVSDAMRIEPAPWMVEIAGRYPPVVGRSLIDIPHPFVHAGRKEPRRDRNVEQILEIVRAFHEAGVVILPGSDLSLAGDGLHRELELYVEAGIPPADVLSLATIGAARAMDLDADLGSVEPGKLADLVLIDGNPLRDITSLARVHTVIKDGRIYDPAALQRGVGVRPRLDPAGHRR